MLRKTMVVSMLAAAALALAPSARAGTDDEVVTITATVDSFAEWASSNDTSIAAADFTGSVDGTTVSAAGEDLTVSRALVLYANATVTITAAGTANSGIATHGTTSDTLTTSYKLTGADITTPDATWKAAGTGAGEFFEAANTYEVTHTDGDGAYTVNLEVQLESDDAAASDAGDYTCSVTLTATWT